MSATVAHPKKAVRATAFLLRCDAPKISTAQQPAYPTATARNSPQQPLFVAPVSMPRNKRNSPLGRQKSRCAPRARPHGTALPPGRTAPPPPPLATGYGLPTSTHHRKEEPDD